jgi:pyrroline-5-carboxylate reductase
MGCATKLLIFSGGIMQSTSFGFIGGGRITWLLLKALQAKQALPAKVIVSDPNSEARAKIQSLAPNVIEAVADNAIAAQADWVFLAVHPPIIKDVLPVIKESLKKQAILISLAPVFNIEKISSMLGGLNRIVRMIPNAPSIISMGYNPVVFNASITAQEKAELKNLFKLWGQAPEVKEENLEAYAIVTAMGQTYFLPQWLKLQKLGQEFGIPEADLQVAMPAMLTGAVATLYQSGLSPAAVIDLIPVQPLKDDEPTIQNIFQTKLTGLYKKMTGK